MDEGVCIKIQIYVYVYVYVYADCNDVCLRRVANE